MGQIATRHYRKEDANACLAIFDSNVPRFFGSEERVEFAQFLREVDRSMFPYLILTLDGRIVACGGLSIGSDPTTASLSWGMVDQDYHRRGLGTLLICERLNLAQSSAGIAELAMATSQHTRCFYERHGFRIERITPNGFAAGLDRYDMTLRLG